MNFFDNKFQTINTAYNTVLKPNKLSIGLVLPIENYSNSPIPSMDEHLKLVKLAESLNFSTLWLRDIPFNMPSFGDVGQIYDPFVYLGMLCAITSKIMLGIASIVLPLRHPANVAKASSSIDRLSNGRLLLGIASGDRMQEYLAFNANLLHRSDTFRQSYEYIRAILDKNPNFSNEFGKLDGSLDMLPKPTSEKIPMLITGFSQQDFDWVVKNSDGWITYPRELSTQEKFVSKYRAKLKQINLSNKPVIQSLYIDLQKDKFAKKEPIHLGYKLGINSLKEHLKNLENIGINHVALNLRLNRTDIKTTLKLISDEIINL